MEFKKGQLLLLGDRKGFYTDKSECTIAVYPIGHSISKGYIIHRDITYFSKDINIKTISDTELCKLLQMDCSWGLAGIFDTDDMKLIKELRKKTEVKNG